MKVSMPYRSHDDRIVTGLSAALARTLGLPPLAVRLGFLLLAAASGVGVVLYAVGTILVPEEDTRARRYADVPRENLARLGREARVSGRALTAWLREWRRRRTHGDPMTRGLELLGGGLFLLGLALVLAALNLFWWIGSGAIAGLILLAIGLSILLGRRSK